MAMPPGMKKSRDREDVVLRALATLLAPMVKHLRVLAAVGALMSALAAMGVWAFIGFERHYLPSRSVVPLYLGRRGRFISQWLRTSGVSKCGVGAGPKAQHAKCWDGSRAGSTGDTAPMRWPAGSIEARRPCSRGASFQTISSEWKWSVAVPVARSLSPS